MKLLASRMQPVFEAVLVLFGFGCTMAVAAAGRAREGAGPDDYVLAAGCKVCAVCHVQPTRRMEQNISGPCNWVLRTPCT